MNRDGDDDLRGIREIEVLIWEGAGIILVTSSLIPLNMHADAYDRQASRSKTREHQKYFRN